MNIQTIDTAEADEYQDLANRGEATAEQLVLLAEYNDKALWESARY